MSKLSDNRIQIRQGYLQRKEGLTVRIRLSRFDDIEKCVLTVKQRINGHVVEIEKKITRRDFDLLSRKADGWLTKVRYEIDGWEVDFFKNGGTYFVMAEIELPEGKECPDHIPSFISENLIFEVPRKDCRFSGKKLGDTEYAKKLLIGLQ